MMWSICQPNCGTWSPAWFSPSNVKYGTSAKSVSPGMLWFPPSLSVNYDACLHAYTQMCQYTCFRRAKWSGFHLKYQIFMQVPSWVSNSRRRSCPHADIATKILYVSGIALYQQRLAYKLQIKGWLYQLCCFISIQAPSDAHMHQEPKPSSIWGIACR